MHYSTTITKKNLFLYKHDHQHEQSLYKESIHRKTATSIYRVDYAQQSAARGCAGPVTSPGIVDYHDKADASVYLLKIKTSLLPTPQAQLIAGSLGIYL